jgi:hypothetical protein
VPDFPGNGIGATRRWFALTETAALFGPSNDPTSGILYGRTNGTPVDPAACDPTSRLASQCPPSSAQPYYATVTQLLAHPTPKFG